MNRVLVDSSVWIAYFKGSKDESRLDAMIDAGTVCINELILTELLPFIQYQKEKRLVGLMNLIPRTSLTIDWDDLRNMQNLNLKHGINKVSIPDLIIAQNAIRNDLELYSLDKHFSLMREVHRLRCYDDG